MRVGIVVSLLALSQMLISSAGCGILDAVLQADPPELVAARAAMAERDYAGAKAQLLKHLSSDRKRPEGQGLYLVADAMLDAEEGLQRLQGLCISAAWLSEATGDSAVPEPIMEARKQVRKVILERGVETATWDEASRAVKEASLYGFRTEDFGGMTIEGLDERGVRSAFAMCAAFMGEPAAAPWLVQRLRDERGPEHLAVLMLGSKAEAALRAEVAKPESLASGPSSEMLKLVKLSDLAVSTSAEWSNSRNGAVALTEEFKSDGRLAVKLALGPCAKENALKMGGEPLPLTDLYAVEALKAKVLAGGPAVDVKETFEKRPVVHRLGAGGRDVVVLHARTTTDPGLELIKVVAWSDGWQPVTVEGLTDRVTSKHRLAGVCAKGPGIATEESVGEVSDQQVALRWYLGEKEETVEVETWYGPMKRTRKGKAFEYDVFHVSTDGLTRLRTVSAAPIAGP
jgi:hypothetical protein